MVKKLTFLYERVLIPPILFLCLPPMLRGLYDIMLCTTTNNVVSMLFCLIRVVNYKYLNKTLRIVLVTSNSPKAVNRNLIHTGAPHLLKSRGQALYNKTFVRTSKFV